MREENATPRTVSCGSCGTSAPGAVSPQVLQEFYVNVTRKIASPLSKPSARAVVDTYFVWCVDTTAAQISAAFRIEDEAGISF